MKIPIYKPQLDREESRNVLNCLESTWISSKGAFIEEFESGFASYTNIKYATTVANGTVALHLALLALGIGKDDEVILPALSYVASANAILYCNAKPVFVDIEEKFWQLDIRRVEEKITSRTKAIMAVHLYGHPTDMIALREMCNKYNLFLIEDCAEAIGSFDQGRHVGSLSDISTFSFFGNKTITTGEGGMVCTNNEKLINICRHLKSQGVSSDRRYYHDVLAYNYRMTNICAAIGVAQLGKLDTILLRKREIYKRYMSNMHGACVEILGEREGAVNSFWMISCRLKSENNRDGLIDHLQGVGIESRPAFPVLTTMPHLKTDEVFPIADLISTSVINLPSHPGLLDSEVDEISSEVINYIRKK